MNSPAVPALVGRILLVLMFLMSGLGKFAGLEGTAGYIASKGLPMPQVLAILAAVVEIAAALMVIIGWRARWGALALIVFTVLASFLFHNFWALPEAQKMMELQAFMKNMAAIGGLLLVFAFGPGPLSLDARRRA